MPRFFMAGTNLKGGMAIIRGRDAEHVRVLRLRPGEDLIICDAQGTDYKCRLVSAEPDKVEAEVIEVVPCPAEPSVAVTVLCGLPPEKKLERWQRIAEEAAKQSGRGIIPQVRWAGEYVEALNIANQKELKIFLYETGEREGLDAVLEANKSAKSVALITGPEGGFAPYEADMARVVGLHVCSMGERILRCETAPVVATTAVMYATGNLS